MSQPASLRICRKCGQEKDAALYHADRRYRDGISATCPDCVHPYRRAYYDRTQETQRTTSRVWVRWNQKRVKANRKRYSKSNAWSRKVGSLNSRAKKAGVPGRLGIVEVREFMLRETMCLRCMSTENLTFDHVIPISQGGENTVANLQRLCRSCNSQKGDTTVDYRIQPVV